MSGSFRPSEKSLLIVRSGGHSLPKGDEDLRLASTSAQSAPAGFLAGQNLSNTLMRKRHTTPAPLASSSLGGPPLLTELSSDYGSRFALASSVLVASTRSRVFARSAALCANLAIMRAYKPNCSLAPRTISASPRTSRALSASLSNSSGLVLRRQPI
jgi:hypothetical protein